MNKTKNMNTFYTTDNQVFRAHDLSEGLFYNQDGFLCQLSEYEEFKGIIRLSVDVKDVYIHKSLLYIEEDLQHFSGFKTITFYGTGEECDEWLDKLPYRVADVNWCVPTCDQLWQRVTKEANKVGDVKAKCTHLMEQWTTQKSLEQPTLPRVFTYSRPSNSYTTNINGERESF